MDKHIPNEKELTRQRRLCLRRELPEPGAENFACGANCPYQALKGGYLCICVVLSDIPGQSRSPAVLLGVFSQLPGSFSDWCFHFSDSGPEVLRSSSPWRPPFILSLGCDVSGSAEPALVLCALGTEHLPRCSHMDAILRFVRYRLLTS